MTKDQALLLDKLAAFLCEHNLYTVQDHDVMYLYCGDEELKEVPGSELNAKTACYWPKYKAVVERSWGTDEDEVYAPDMKTAIADCERFGDKVVGIELLEDVRK